jgi:hypothetical protein
VISAATAIVAVVTAIAIVVALRSMPRPAGGDSAQDQQAVRPKHTAGITSEVHARTQIAMVENLRKSDPRILSIGCASTRALATSVHTAFIFALDALSNEKTTGSSKARPR